MWLRARGEEAEYRIAGRHSVTLENLAHFFQVIFGENYTLWLFCFESFKNCIANIFLFVNCWLCTRADSKVSFYILEVSLLVISKYKNMQENYEKWKIIQKELHIQKCNFMWEEIENDEGRNIKHHRKKTKKPRKKHAGRNTNPCRMSFKIMLEEMQSHARRNTKPCQKKYKIQREDQQQASGTARPINQNRPLPTMTVCVQCTHTLHYHHQGLEYWQKQHHHHQIYHNQGLEYW